MTSYASAGNVHPTVAMAEVFRKIVAYSLARPARESLFTVVSREEKYKAKIFLDTVVQVSEHSGVKVVCCASIWSQLGCTVAGARCLKHVVLMCAADRRHAGRRCVSSPPATRTWFRPLRHGGVLCAGLYRMGAGRLSLGAAARAASGACC